MLEKIKCLLRSMAFNLYLNDVVLLERTISAGREFQIGKIRLKKIDLCVLVFVIGTESLRGWPRRWLLGLSVLREARGGRRERSRFDGTRNTIGVKIRTWSDEDVTEAAISIARPARIPRRSSFASSGQLDCVILSLFDHYQVIVIEY